jgi:hypothetical protein
MPQKHSWEFRKFFRANAFGWKGSKLAVQRIKEAVREVRKTKDPILRAEGAILLMERLWPALQQVDSSSGALGTATNNAVHELVQYVIDAPAEPDQREKWLDSLWKAMEEDGVDFLYEVSERWGELCADMDVASRWADHLRFTLELSWQRGGYFRGTPACLSCLLQAQRFDELLKLIEKAPYRAWSIRKYGAQALAVSGKVEEAIGYAENSQGLNDSPVAIAAACEQILIGAGRRDEAYRRFAHGATKATTYLARFRALVKKYPHKPENEILQDLVSSTPGEEGKWFATAKTLGLFDIAADLARCSPVDIATLNRAARDFLQSQPDFALKAALASLHWLCAGQFYEITGTDVYNALMFAYEASAKLGNQTETLQQISARAADPQTDDFVRQQIEGYLKRHRV